MQQESLNTNHLSHQHDGHSQTPVALFGAQPGQEEHLEFLGHPLHGVYIWYLTNSVQNALQMQHGWDPTLSDNYLADQVQQHTDFP